MIIILSGCVEDYPKTEFKKTFSRVADSDEELAVIDFIETFDFLEFTGPGEAEGRHIEDFYIYMIQIYS